MTHSNLLFKNCRIKFIRNFLCEPLGEARRIVDILPDYEIYYDK